MFYSEQLLSKTGPLARVWLASNVERKLSKSQILQSDIQTSVGAIVDQGQEPMALRLSSQLMLGVVRIYGRKARYLLDDCNEALLKIRMTFKSTNNHDLPAGALTAIDLNLPELLTIDDLFPAMDFAYPLTQQPAIEGNRMQDLDRDWTSTLNPQQSTQSRLSPDDQALYEEDDLQLDIGDRDEPTFNDTTVSVQYGRNAPTPRAPGESILAEERLLHDDDDLNLELGFEDDVPMIDQPADDGEPSPLPAGDVFDTGPIFGDEETMELEQGRERDVETPLSEADSAVLRELDRTFAPGEEEVEELAVQQPQRSRKFKPMVADVETVLHNRQIKAQAEDRSKILRPASFLPRDPVLLTLMNMQKNGEFATNAMNDGRSKFWAPELQGLLSFEVVHRSGQLKRKRDSGIADISDDEHSDKSPRLEVEDVDNDAQFDEGVEVGNVSGQAFDSLAESGIEPIRTDDPALADVIPGEDDEGIFAGVDDFDETTAPLVHPADNGPVSLGTKRAVHLLRERFGGSETETSPSSQSKRSVLLQDLVPERRTSNENATKMFFEILVLATKDAIKVEQENHSIGLPLRIRGKRGLWGSWAENEPGESQDAASAGVEVTASA